MTFNVNKSSVLIILLCIILAGCKNTVITKPNILFIAIDDLRPELGCYGNEIIKTPNIDRLAESGLLFNRAYCQQAVCNPSRASLLTGLRPDAIKVTDLYTHFREFRPDVVTLPQYFMEHGYHVEGLGKIFHGGSRSDPQSWSVPKKNPTGHSLYPDTAVARQQRRRDSLVASGVPREMLGHNYRGRAVMAVDEPDNRRYDGAMTDLAVSTLGELKEPFFYAVGYFKPHLPFVAPKKYFDLYDPDEIPMTANGIIPEGIPPFALNTMYELRAYEDYFGTPTPFEGELTDAQRRNLKHGYYACVSFIDAQVGRLIQALNDNDLADNTIIILWGDHGWKLGEHNSWGKMTNYEIDTRVPLMIVVPWMHTRGKESFALVELVDIYPTLCDLAGLTIPGDLEGLSFAPVISDPSRDWKKAVFSQYKRWYNPAHPWKTEAYFDYMRENDGETFMGYSIRTDEYRYIEWLNMENGEFVARELYDQINDPEENTNIAEFPENDLIMTELSGQLKKGWKGALPENEEKSSSGIK